MRPLPLIRYNRSHLNNLLKDGVLTQEEFEKAGLQMVRELEWEQDIVQYWTRKEIPWPSDTWPLPSTSQG